MCWRAGIAISRAVAGSVRIEFSKNLRDAGDAGSGPASIFIAKILENSQFLTNPHKIPAHQKPLRVDFLGYCAGCGFCGMRDLCGIPPSDTSLAIIDGLEGMDSMST